MEHRGGCASARGRRRLPGNALVELPVELGLADALPVGYRLRRILLDGWVSCGRGANEQTRMVWAGTQAEQECAAPGRFGAIGGGRGGSPMWVRIRSTGAASALKAIMRMSAPKLGQVGGIDSNSRANRRDVGPTPCRSALSVAKPDACTNVRPPDASPTGRGLLIRAHAVPARRPVAAPRPR
jgi:hypothetical protein